MSAFRLLMSRDTKVLAPFTDDQVASLNAHQESGHLPPYTCEAPFCHDRDVIGESFPLAADRDGLHCIGGFGCTYTLTWAYSRTTDWSWRAAERREMNRGRRRARGGLRTLRRHMRIFAGEPVFTRRDWIRLAAAVLIVAAAIAVAHSPIGNWRFP